MQVKIRIDRAKLKNGPAATVAARAHSGAPIMVERFSASSRPSMAPSSAMAPEALPSPRNFT